MGTCSRLTTATLITNKGSYQTQNKLAITPKVLALKNAAALTCITLDPST